MRYCGSIDYGHLQHFGAEYKIYNSMELHIFLYGNKVDYKDLDVLVQYYCIITVKVYLVEFIPLVIKSIDCRKLS